MSIIHVASEFQQAYFLAKPLGKECFAFHFFTEHVFVFVWFIMPDNNSR